jgi:SAM-dependent methyltransferase
MNAFHVSGEAYDRFMGRFSIPLGLVFADFAGIRPGTHVVDVGCGPGALTRELVRRLGPEQVAAADPSASFVVACRERHPSVDVREAPAEQLPWADDSFDAALAQLVIAFVDDPDAATLELRRVVRPGGVVATCMWDGERMEMLRLAWDAAKTFDPNAPDERLLPFRTERELRELFEANGLEDVATGPLDVIAGYDSFDELWATLISGVGTAGSYTASLDDERRELFRDELRERLGNPSGSFRLAARAWGVRGLVPR